VDIVALVASQATQVFVAYRDTVDSVGPLDILVTVAYQAIAVSQDLVSLATQGTVVHLGIVAIRDTVDFPAIVDSLDPRGTLAIVGYQVILDIVEVDFPVIAASRVNQVTQDSAGYLDTQVFVA
jgi:D-arabinose 1-dehydrogenase-like Zn-dependent alcohol dehydrogenase